MSSLRSDNMQGLLQLFFCLVLLAKGNCLQCEKCESNSTSCTGPKQNCTNGEACIIAISESRLARNTPRHNFTKSCGSPTVCDKPQLHFDLGNGYTYHMHHYCCSEEDCFKTAPTLPPMQKDPKGKRCPACNTMGEPCKKDTVQCSGKDTDCFTVTMNQTSNGKQVLHTMKGCGSKNVCDRFESVKEEGVKGPVKCSFQSGSGASQALASFLMTFYSLWILKLLI